jgi:CrcB protein
LLAFVVVFVGAGLGAVLRWRLGAWLNPVFPTVPLGTLAANLLGEYLWSAATALAHLAGSLALTAVGIGLVHLLAAARV